MPKTYSSTVSTSATAVSSAITAATAYLAGLGWDLTQIDWSLAINWLIGVTGVGAATGYATSKKPDKHDFQLDESLPLGLRNRNPGNLRPSRRYKWRGEIGENKGFVVFDSDTNGIRAMARNIRNQQKIHGLNTLESILHKYAPPSENDTENYVDFVSRHSSIKPHVSLDLMDNALLVSILVPMIRLENGEQPYSTEKIIESVKLI